MTLAGQQKYYKLPDTTSIKGIRPILKKDFKDVEKLLNTYLEQFPIHQVFSYDEIVRTFTP